MIERSAGPDFTSYWNALDAFAEKEVSIYGMFRHVASNLGRRRAAYELVDNGQRITYRYGKPILLAARGVWDSREVSLSEIYIIASRKHTVQPRLQVLSVNEGGAHRIEETYIRPEIHVDPQTMAYQGFARLDRLLIANQAVAAEQQDSYFGWLDIVNNAIIAADTPT